MPYIQPDLNDIHRAYRDKIATGTLAGTQGSEIRALRVGDRQQVVLQEAQGRYRFVSQAQIFEVIRQVHWSIDEEFKRELQKQIEFLTGTQYRSLSELAWMGHPYGYGKTSGRKKRARQAPPKPLQYINNQGSVSGAIMARSWGYDIDQGNVGLGRDITDLVYAENTTPQSAELSWGTTLMQPRPYAEHAAQNAAIKLLSGGILTRAKKTLEDAGITGYTPHLPTVEYMLGDRRRIGTVENGVWSER